MTLIENLRQARQSEDPREMATAIDGVLAELEAAEKADADNLAAVKTACRAAVEEADQFANARDKAAVSAEYRQHVEDIILHGAELQRTPGRVEVFRCLAKLAARVEHYLTGLWPTQSIDFRLAKVAAELVEILDAPAPALPEPRRIKPLSVLIDQEHLGSFPAAVADEQNWFDADGKPDAAKAADNIRRHAAGEPTDPPGEPPAPAAEVADWPALCGLSSVCDMIQAARAREADYQAPAKPQRTHYSPLIAAAGRLQRLGPGATVEERLQAIGTR